MGTMCVASCAMIQSNTGNQHLDPEEAIRASLIALPERLDSGEIEKITHLLPAELRKLLPDYADETELMLPL